MYSVFFYTYFWSLNIFSFSKFETALYMIIKKNTFSIFIFYILLLNKIILFEFFVFISIYGTIKAED